MVASLRHLAYKEQLEKLKLPSMHYRRERGNKIMVYQNLTGGIRIDHTMTRIFSRAPPDTTTRGHSLKLIKPPANHVQRQKAFSHRVVNKSKWNSLRLHEEVVNARTVNRISEQIPECSG